MEGLMALNTTECLLMEGLMAMNTTECLLWKGVRLWKVKNVAFAFAGATTASPFSGAIHLREVKNYCLYVAGTMIESL